LCINITKCCFVSDVLFIRFNLSKKGETERAITQLWNIKNADSCS